VEYAQIFVGKLIFIGLCVIPKKIMVIIKGMEDMVYFPENFDKSNSQLKDW
jgi:hypothetical protein